MPAPRFGKKRGQKAAPAQPAEDSGTEEQHDPLIPLTKVLHRLPMADAQRATIPGWALRLKAAHILGAISELPRSRLKGGNVARRELETVVKQAVALLRSLLAMHSEALRAFEKVEPRGALHPLLLDDTLADFARAAICARETITPSPTLKGRPKSEHARQVTIAARDAYERLTGKRAGRVTDPYSMRPAHGPFITFLREIFEVFEIKDSADGQAHAILYPPSPKKPPAKPPL